MSIEVKNLTRIYGEQKAIDQISFSVNRGEIVGFLGPNGAGKSTTMKILTGCLKPDSGQALLNGIDVNVFPVRTKKLTGYLPESNPLYGDMYVREYLSFIADIHHLTAKKEKINSVIDQVGLRPEAGKKISQLSKGYKQRVGLAAALVHSPEVLILDEPTTGLDPNQIVEIRDVIKNYGKNRTVLFSSHILQEVEAICDRVIIIHQGKIIADNNLSELRQQQNGNFIKVVLKEGVGAESWEGLSQLISARKTSDYEWELEAKDTELLKKQLLTLSLQNNWNIVSLQSENRSLEDIFRGLTKTITHE
ncbi:MAG TPA: gliding motility-associated ABC transporter ATP-binding subunit GldA [Puia sp.]|nr:gliding motility-associated ABC transporter ATP-binding subunit GldA [Puia sp.]